MIDTPRASRILLLFVSIVLAVTPAALAQNLVNPRVSWDTRQNGTEGDSLLVGAGLLSRSGTRDRGKHHAVAVDSSGNVYVVGQLQSTMDLAIVAYDRRGIERWRRTKGGVGNGDDGADAVAVDSVGNVYVAGWVYTGGTPPTHGYDAIVISYDTNGNERWTTPLLVSGCTSANTACYDDDFADIVAKSGLICAVGSTRQGASAFREMMVNCFDSTGTGWVRLVSDASLDVYGRSVALDDAGNVYVAGVRGPSSGGLADFLTASFTSAGDLRWTRPEDAPGSAPPTAPLSNTPYSIAVGGGRVYVTGGTATPTSGGAENAYFTVAYESTFGVKQWARAAESTNNHAWDVVADSSGNAYVTGEIGTGGGCYTVSYGPAAYDPQSPPPPRWERTTDIACYAAAIDSNSNVYVTGSTGAPRPGMLIQSYTSAGDPRWRKVKRTTGDGDADGLALATSPWAVYAAGSRIGSGNAEFVTVNLAMSDGSETWAARSRAATSFSVADGKPSHAKHAVATDAGGNTYVAGRKWNGANYDMYVVSYGPAGGTPLWQAVTNGPAGLNDWARAVTVAPGGRVIVTGVTEAANHEFNYMTVCYSAADGHELWAAPAVKDGAGNDDDLALAVVADSSGRAFVTGRSFSGSPTYFDFLTVAYNTATGAQLWSVTGDGATHGNDEASDITLDQSGSVWVTGTSGTSSTTDILTIKYNPSSGEETARAVTTRSGYNIPEAIVASGSGVYITGRTISGGTSSCLTMKYDLSGTELWQDEVASTSTGDAAGTALAFDSANNILHVGGYAVNASGNRDFLEIRYAGGSTPGQATFTDYSGASDAAYSVTVDPNGIVFLTGISDNGTSLFMMTAAFQPNGTRLWTHLLDPLSWNDGQGFAVAPLPGRGAVVAGGLSDSIDCLRTIAYSFSVPTITAGAALSRSAGGTPQLADPLVNIHDDDTATSSLVVTAINVPPDLTVGPITVNGAYNKATATVGATCSATTADAKTIVMRVRNSGYVTATANVTVNVTANTPPLLGLYNDKTIRTGEPTVVSPSADWSSGKAVTVPTDNGTVTINAVASAGFTGTITPTSSDGKLTITNPGPGNGAFYTITVTPTDNCGLAGTPKTFYLTVTGPPPPSNVRAAATSTSTVHLTWDPTPGALSYDVWRSSLNSGYSRLLPSLPAGSISFDNINLTPNTTYLYYVIANISGGSTYRSNIDPATTILFTDDALQAGTTVVKAIHFDELRTAVNAFRAAAGLTAISFTPSTLTGVAIASQHLTDLRSALMTAVTTLNTPFVAPPFPQLTPAYPATAGTPIRAADVTEIRNAVK